MKGLHIIADLYGCRNREMLASSAKLREICVAACKDVGLTVLGDHFYQFAGLDATQVGGATGAVVFAESHLAVHTWPERDYAAFDVFMCGDAKPELAVEVLREAFSARDVVVKTHRRGEEMDALDWATAAIKQPPERVQRAA